MKEVLYPSMHQFLRSVVQKEFRMLTTRLVDDRPRRTYPWCRGARCVFLVVLGLSLLLPAQRIDAPPRLEPTANALSGLQRCGESIARSAPQISSKLLEAQGLLTRGLLIGWNNPSGEFAAVPPPREYVAELAREADWCLKVANVLNTEPAKKTEAENVMISITNDLVMKVEDCRQWGMARMITLVASTLKNGHPDPGWTVVYKWVSVSGLSSTELSFPKISTPTSQVVPPGIYSIYATKQVGDTLMKTEPKTISAFQRDKVQCEIPVP